MRRIQATGLLLLIAAFAAMSAEPKDDAIIMAPRLPHPDSADRLPATGPLYDPIPLPEMDPVAFSASLIRPLIARDDLLPLREAETYDRALELIHGGAAEEGEQLLRALIALAPDDDTRVRARIALGESLLRRGEAPGAAEAIGRALEEWKSRPQRWRLQYWHAVALAEGGMQEEALHALLAAADQIPAGECLRAEALRWAGWLQAGQGDLVAANRTWERALAAAEGYTALADRIRFDLAESYFTRGRGATALELLEAIDDASAWPGRYAFLRARLYLDLGRLDAARAAWEHFLTLDIEVPEYWLEEAHEALGWLALRAGETETAFTHYRDAASEERSERPLAAYGAGVALIAAGRYAEAVEMLAPVAPVAPEDSLHLPWTYALAYAHFHEGDYVSAIEVLESFRGLTSPDSLGRAAWSLRGDCYYRIGEPEEAYAAYTKAASVFFDVPELLYRRQALAAIATERWGAAARFLGDLIAKFPGTRHQGEYNFWRAEAFYRLGRLEMARRHFERAARLGTQRAACAYALGVCDYEERRYQDAVARFDQAVELCEECPFEVDLLLRRGNSLFNIGEVHAAVRAYGEAMEAAERGAAEDAYREAAFRRAWGLLRLEDFAEAQRAFAALRERAPHDARAAEALYWEGQTYFRREMYTEALARFGQILTERAAHDSLRAQALLASGDAHFNQGEYEEALEWYRQILEAPGADRALRRSAHESLFECRSARGEWDQARQILLDLEREFPETQGTGEKHLEIAEAQYAEKSYTAALRAYGDFLERTPEDDPRQSHVRYQMARCREALGQREAAAAAYEALGEDADFRQRSAALLRAGLLRLDLDQARRALRSLEMRLSLSLDPRQTALTHAYLAEAYQKLDESAAARNEWEKVATDDVGAPDSLRAVASLHLGRMAFGDREWAAAYAGFATADSLGFVAPAYRLPYWAGEAAFRMGNLPRAREWLERFLAAGEDEALWEATARIRLAECYEGLELPAGAIEQYRRVTELSLEEGTLLEEAARRLHALEQAAMAPSAETVSDSQEVRHGPVDVER